MYKKLPQTIDTLQKVENLSSSLLLQHLRDLRAKKVDIASFHPLLAMLVTVNYTTAEYVSTPYMKGKRFSRPKFKGASSEFVYSLLLDSKTVPASTRFAKMLDDHLRVNSNESIMRQLAYHSWAAMGQEEKPGIVRDMLLPYNKVSSVCLPFSLLVTPTKPVLFSAPSNPMSPQEILSAYKWLKGLVFTG